MSTAHKRVVDTAPEIEIRPAVLSDLDALVELENRSFELDRLPRRSFRRLISSRTADCRVALQQGRLVGYALNLFRRGTALARLYSVAIDQACRGRGIAGRLLQAVEKGALNRGCVFQRLEVRPDNLAAIALYRARGYREFGRHLDYYEDHADALRFEKRLAPPVPRQQRATPYYAQTTDFTCGPACLLMAMARFDPGLRPDRRKELRLWRESTLIYMTAGHGGCEPFGLAVALARRGFRAEVHVNRNGPLFLDSVRNKDKRLVMALIQQDFRSQARELHIPVHYRALRSSELVEVLDRGAIAIVLVSSYRMLHERTPHWVVLHDHDEKFFYVHDPWIEREDFESAVAAADLPIPIAEFHLMARYGRSKLRAVVVIDGKSNGETAA